MTVLKKIYISISMSTDHRDGGAIISNQICSIVGSIKQLILLKRIYDYCNTWNLIKSTIIIIISKSSQGKTYAEYEAGKISLGEWNLDL